MSLTSATRDTSLEDHMSGFVKKMETGQKKDHHVKVTLMSIESISILSKMCTKKGYWKILELLGSKLYLSSSAYIDLDISLVIPIE